jgi:hypothetical protein
MLHLEHRVYGAESWTLWKADQKYLKKVLKLSDGEEWRRSAPLIV